MNTDQEIQQIRERIAQVFAHREHLKQDLECGVLSPRSGFPLLEQTDRELSQLDSRFKALWDAAHPQNVRSSQKESLP